MVLRCGDGTLDEGEECDDLRGDIKQAVFLEKELRHFGGGEPVLEALRALASLALGGSRSGA